MKKATGILGLVLMLGFPSCNKEAVQLSYDAQLQKDDATIDAYLAGHGINAIQNSSGLRYAITSLGTGAKPSALGRVVMGVIGEFLSTSQVFAFDTIPQNNQVVDLLQGFQIVLPLIPKGSKFTLYCPSGLAYGPNGSANGVVPGNANVIYEVTLLDDDAQLKADKATIDAYLTNQGITTAIKDTSGLRYVINSPGTGTRANYYSTINVDYNGKFLNGTQFGAQMGANFMVMNLILGWQIGLPFIQQGGTITLYIPSGLAYGPAGSGAGSIPKNANLIYVVTLNEVD